MEIKGSKIAKTIFKKKEVRRLIRPDLKTFYRSTVIMAVWFWHNKRHTDQWNKTDGKEINSYIYVKEQGCPNNSMCKELSSTKGAKTTRYSPGMNEVEPLTLKRIQN